MVEVILPCRHQIAGMAQAVEQVLVQQLVPHPAVEALHKTILHWLAGCDVVPLDPSVLLPLQDRVARQFRPVVRDHHAGVASHLGDPVQLAGDPGPRQRCVDDGR